MIDRASKILLSAALVAGVILSCGIALYAPDVFAKDAGAEPAEIPPAEKPAPDAGAPDVQPNEGIGTSTGLNVETASAIIEAFRAAKYLVAIGLLVLVFVAALNRWVLAGWEATQTKFWRTVIAGAVAAASAVGVALAEGAPLSLDLVAAAFVAAASAAGVHRWLKNATGKAASAGLPRTVVRVRARRRPVRRSRDRKE